MRSDLVERPQADELLAVGPLERLAAGHDAADIVLSGRHHATQPEVVGRRGAVEFGARHMALLDAHDRQRLDAVGRDAELRPACMIERTTASP
jgi:hypothetical protein